MAELSAGLVARLRSTRRPRRRASTMPISRNTRTCRLVVDLLSPSTRANSVKLNNAAPSARTICVRLGSQSTVRTRSRSDEASPSRRAACAARTRPLGGPAGGKPLADDSTLTPPHWHALMVARSVWEESRQPRQIAQSLDGRVCVEAGQPEGGAIHRCAAAAGTDGDGRPHRPTPGLVELCPKRRRSGTRTTVPLRVSAPAPCCCRPSNSAFHISPRWTRRHED
jgi:hypothetical protein